MRTDTEIRVEGLRVLAVAMGDVQAERFITLIMREPFDYTKWQRTLWPNQSVDQISRSAMQSRRRPIRPRASRCQPRRSLATT
jgi:hypothetical protein